jgi:hypothetical protein
MSKKLPILIPASSFRESMHVCIFIGLLLTLKPLLAEKVLDSEKVLYFDARMDSPTF